MVKKLLIIILLVLSILPFFSVQAYANETDVPDEYVDFMNELPNDIKELLPEGLFSSNSNEMLDAAEEISGWDFIFDVLINLVGINWRDILKHTAVICSVLVISSVIRSLKDSVSNEATVKIIELISSVILVTILIEQSREPLTKTMQLLENIKIFVNTMSPLVCSMYAMGGNVSSALVSNYGLIVFLSIFENMCILALETILGICLALTLASSFVEDGNLLSISSALKKTFTFIIGFLMLVFTTVISTQGILASRAESLITKTTKMLVSQLIPVVGSTVGETLKTAGASVEYLRTSIGVVLIVAFVILILPTFLNVFLHRLALIISNGIAGLLGCRKEGGVLSEISSIYGYAIAIISICAIALLFLLTIFAKSSSPLT